MCNPVLIASAAISTASEAQRVKGVNKQIEAQSAQAISNFNRNAKTRMDQLDLQKDQFEQDQFFQAIELAKSRAASDVAFAGSGVSGISQQRVLNDLEIQDQLKTNVAEKNLSTAARNTESAIQSDFLNTQQTLKNLESQRPTLFSSALNIAGGTLSLGTSVMGIQNQIAQQ